MFKIDLALIKSKKQLLKSDMSINVEKFLHSNEFMFPPIFNEG